MPYRSPRQNWLRAAIACAIGALLAPAGASADAITGGASYVPPPPPAKRAKLVGDIAIPPRSAPPRVKQVMEAANRIIRLPYVYGGGHRTYIAAQAAFERLDRGYDCSGTVSFALFGGGFIKSPLDSSGFMGWGLSGKGRWITVYTNPGHAYVVIGGLRLDTSGGDRVGPRERNSGSGPRWRKYSRSPAGYTIRHPVRY